VGNLIRGMYMRNGCEYVKQQENECKMSQIEVI
jgi:hypothetical protein